MLAKVKSKMLMASPCWNVDEGVFDDIKVIGETPRWNVSEGVVNVEVGGEAPCKNVGEGIAGDADIIGESPFGMLMKA